MGSDGLCLVQPTETVGGRSPGHVNVDVLVAFLATQLWLRMW